MEIGYTAEQEDCARAARVLREAARSRHGGRAPASRVVSAARSRAIWKQMCADGWAGIGWPKEYGGQGRSAIEQFIFFDESMRAGAPVPMLTINSVGPTIMRVRHRRAEGRLPAEDPRRRHPLLHRLLRARRRHRPRVAQDACRARRRRVRDQRPEDVDVARRRRRLLLARGAHRPRGAEAQGHLDDHRARWTRRASRCRRSTCSATTTSTQVFFDDVARARRQRRRRREQRAGRSSPTSSTTSGSRCARAA